MLAKSMYVKQGFRVGINSSTGDTRQVEITTDDESVAGLHTSSGKHVSKFCEKRLPGGCWWVIRISDDEILANSFEMDEMQLKRLQFHLMFSVFDQTVAKPLPCNRPSVMITPWSWIIPYPCAAKLNISTGGF